MDLSFTRRGSRRSRRRCAAGSPRNVEVPPRFETIAERGRVRPGVAGAARRRTAGSASTGPRPTAAAARRRSQVAIFNMEYARSRALQPINRVGINLAGPTLLAHGTEEQKQRWLPSILTRRRDLVPAVQRAGRGLRPRVARRPRPCASTTAGCCRGRRCGRRYAQFARWGICLARTDPDAPKHKGISYLVVDMQAPGIEVRPLVQITGDAEFNEVFFDEVFVPDDHLVGASAQRLGGRQHDARARAGHRVPVQGAGRARGVPRRALAARGRRAARSTTWRSPTRSRSRSWSCACCGCTTGARCRGSRRASSPGPESSITQARLDRHDARRSRRGRSTSSARRRRCGGAPTTTPAAASGSGSGCGRRRRRSRAARRRCSARSSATGSSACRDEGRDG